MTTENFLIPFLTGGLSKSIASFTLMPINVVRLRLQMKQYSAKQVEDLKLRVETNTMKEAHYTGFIDCASKILRNEGPAAFYKGLTPNLIKVFPSSGMFFLAYEYTLRAIS